MWKANPAVPPSADLVMQWWERAAKRLTAAGTVLRRFGLVATNSITQEFSRRVIARHLAPAPLPSNERNQVNSSPVTPGLTRSPASSSRDQEEEAGPRLGGRGDEDIAVAAGDDRADPPRLSLVMACPDHPWTKATRDSAAVRIAMTVAEAGAREGMLVEVEAEAGLDTDTPAIRVGLAHARIHADLVALNAERAAEEKAGHVRWLRPDYQRPRFGKAEDGR